MSKKSKTYAYPQSEMLSAQLWQTGGLTKREMFAFGALQGLLASLNPAVEIDADGIANNAVVLADYLLRRLEAE